MKQAAISEDTREHEGGIPDKLTDMIKLALAIRQP